MDTKEDILSNFHHKQLSIDRAFFSPVEIIYLFFFHFPPSPPLILKLFSLRYAYVKGVPFSSFPQAHVTLGSRPN